MMSLSTIRQLSREAAERAADQGKRPYLVEQEDIEYWRDRQVPFPFPNLGDYVPDGWEQVDTLFCDSSGWGAPGEPALTREQLLDVLEPGFGYAVIEAGQFQVYLGKFKRV
jgi:hypothetical protein